MVRSTPRSWLLLTVCLFALVACAGGDSEGDDDGIDASITVDAGPADAEPADARPPDPDPDAGQGGLGQICDQSTPCPADAPLCTVASSGSARGACTAVCAADFAFMTNGTGNPTTTPGATSTATCTAIFDGTAGTPACLTFLLETFDPAVTGTAPAPSTAYTADVACAIRCGAGNACPTGLTCSNMFCRP
jgi:hypothetical protein